MSLVSHYAVEWPLSWMLHATVSSIFALVAGRWMIRDPASRDTLWKAALVLPLATSILSVAVSPFTARSLDLATFARAHMPPALRAERVSVQMTAATAPATVQVEDATAQWLRYAALAAMLIPAVVTTTRRIRSRRRFWRELRSRRPARSRELCAVRPQSSSGRSIQVTVSPAISSAAAVARDEICVSSTFTALGRLEQRSVLAHEMAHLERRDLAWLAFADAVACALAAQPLVRMVACRLRRDTEFICDDIAVGKTGDAPAYVRALTALASEYDTIAVPVLAYATSPIVQRAERVLGPSRPSGHVTPRVAAILVLLLLTGLLSLPRVSTGSTTRSRVSVHRVSDTRTQISVTLNGR